MATLEKNPTLNDTANSNINRSKIITIDMSQKYEIGCVNHTPYDVSISSSNYKSNIL